MHSVSERILFVLACALATTGCKEDASDGATDDTGAVEAGDSTGDESGDDAMAASSEGADETAGAVDLGPWDTLDERPCPEDSFVTYENFGWPHMLTFCTGCHSSMLPADMRQGAPIEINFDSLADVRQRADRVWARAGDQHTTMPPVGPAVDDERMLLGEWLACGSPTDADLVDE